MQYRIKGKGNINVQAMGGQREVRGSRHRRNLLPVLAECGKCVKVWMQAQQKQPPQQKDLHVSHCPAVVCVLSCPVPSAPPDPWRSQHTALWDLGQGTPQQLTQLLGKLGS